MLLKYIELACKNAKRSTDQLISKLSFSLVSEQSNTYHVKHNSINFILRQTDTNFDRVSNIGLSSSNLSTMHYNLMKRTFIVSDVKECNLFPHHKCFDLQSPFKNIKHRIYDDNVMNDVSDLSGDNLFRKVDHILFCCEKNTAHDYAIWYNKAFGMSNYQCEGSSSEGMVVKIDGVGMKMHLIQGGNLPIFGFSEPIMDRPVGFNQVDRFIKANEGPGVQHIALMANNIINVTKSISERGVSLVQQPHTYYDIAEKKAQFEEVGLIPSVAEKNNVIIDRERDGHLLQVFTESLFDKDGLFLELIERRGARGFGQANIKALFFALQKQMEGN